MCTACPEYAHPPHPIPPFLVTQNLSSKQIGPTDNMRPKLHDEYTCHQVKLKTWKYYQWECIFVHWTSLKLCVGLLLMPMYSILPAMWMTTNYKHTVQRWDRVRGVGIFRTCRAQYNHTGSPPTLVSYLFHLYDLSVKVKYMFLQMHSHMHWSWELIS